MEVSGRGALACHWMWILSGGAAGCRHTWGSASVFVICALSQATKDACFLSHTFCGQSSARGLGRMWSSWAVISSENQERLPGHVVIGKMQLLMAAGGRSHTLEGCQLGTARLLVSWPPPQDGCPMAFFKLVDPVFSIPAFCREAWARL